MADTGIFTKDFPNLGRAVLGSDLAVIAVSGDEVTYKTTVSTLLAGAGTVTSVAALTLGTTGNDLSSTVATGTTTPVITLNVPTASSTKRGVLSAADWTTFNSKQAAGNYFTQSGNAFGASAVLGTTDNYSLSLMYNSAIKQIIDSSGVKIETSLYFKENTGGIPAPLAGYAGMAYRDVTGLHTFGDKALVLRFNDGYVWEKTTAEWMGLLTFTGLGVGIREDDLEDGPIDRVDVRRGNVLIYNIDGSKLQVRGSSTVNKNIVLSDNLVDSYASSGWVDNWSIGQSVVDVGGNAADFSIGKKVSGTWSAPMIINKTTSAVTFAGAVTASSFIGALTGNASTATSLAGGLGGQIPYQSAVNTTALLANGTAGQVLQSNGTTAAPSWVSVVSGVSSVTAANTTLTISPTTGAVIAGINLATANTWTGAVTIQQSPGADTVGYGLILENPNAAALADQQYAPYIKFTSRAWLTTGSTSELNEWRIGATPIQGSTASSSTLMFDWGRAGGAFTNYMNLTSAGQLGVFSLVVVNGTATAGAITTTMPTSASLTYGLTMRNPNTGNNSAVGIGFQTGAAANHSGIYALRDASNNTSVILFTSLAGTPTNSFTVNSAGNLTFTGTTITAGAVVMTAPGASGTLAALNGTNTWTGANTLNGGDLIVTGADTDSKVQLFRDYSGSSAGIGVYDNVGVLRIGLNGNNGTITLSNMATAGLVVNSSAGLLSSATTVSAGTAVASTNKLAVDIGGVTYYILLTTVA